jgi:hypothetical protein
MVGNTDKTGTQGAAPPKPPIGPTRTALGGDDPRKKRPVKYVDIPLSELWIDREVIAEDEVSVQRPVDEAWWRYIAATFDDELLGMVTVYQMEDGRYVATDGQHRILAAREVGYDGTIHAKVVYGTTRASGAHSFIGVNRTKNVSPVAKFERALLASPEFEGYEVEVDIAEMLAERNLQIGPTNAKRNGNTPLTCAAKYISLYKDKQLGGPDVVESITDTLLAGFPNDPPNRVITSETLTVMANIIKAYKDEVRKPDLERMVVQLKDVGFSEMERKRDLGRRHDRSLPKVWHMAAAFITVYNEGLPPKQKLTTWYHLTQQSDE